MKCPELLNAFRNECETQGLLAKNSKFNLQHKAPAMY